MPLINLTAALALALSGPGAYALDPMLGIALPQPLIFGVGLVLVFLGIAAALLGQARQEAPTGHAGRGRA